MGSGNSRRSLEKRSSGDYFRVEVKHGENKMNKERLLTLLREQQPYLMEKFNVNRIGIFGSYARGVAGGASDIDIVVELGSPIGFRFMELCEYLENVLGKKVDVLTTEGVRQIRLPEVARSIEKEITYV